MSGFNLKKLNYCFTCCILLMAFWINTSYSGEAIIAEDLTESAGMVKLVNCEKEPESQFIFKTLRGKLDWNTSKVQTPLGTPAYRIKVSENKMPAALYIKAIFKPEQSWRDKKYFGLSFWYKGDGSKTKCPFTFNDSNGNKGAKFLDMESKEWQKVTISTYISGSKVNLAKIKQITLKITGAVDICISDIVMEEGSREVYLDKCRKTLVPLIKNPPRIDGNITDSIWADIPSMGDFFKIKTNNELPQMKTEVKLAHDGEKLYCASRLFYDDVSKAEGLMDKQDDPVFQEDDIELFVDSNNDNFTYFQIAFGLAGGIFDMKRYYDIDLCMYTRSKKWNAEGLSSKIMKTSNSVDHEIDLPFSDVDVKPFENIYSGFQVGRTNKSLSERFPEYSSWSPTVKFPRSDKFGIIIYGRQEPSPFQFSGISISEIKTGKYILSGLIKNLRSERDVNLTITINNPPGTVHRFTEKIKLHKGINSFRKILDIPSISEGGHHLALVIDSDEKQTPQVEVFSLNVTVPLNIKYGEITFNPQPKELKYEKGNFPLKENLKIAIIKNATERTRKTADYLSQKLYNHTGVKLPVYTLKENYKVKDNTLIVAEEKRLKGICSKYREDISQLKPEGYVLDIKPDCIAMSGKDEAGLYYSVVTFCQILSAPEVKSAQETIPCLKISDWPDLEYRYIDFTFGALSRNLNRAKILRQKKMEFFKNYIKTFIAGNKCNLLSFSPATCYKWEKNPELSYNAFLDKNDLREIADFCREHFVELVPNLNLAGHDGYFLHREHPELREQGYNQMADLEHPEYKRLVIDCLDELIEACNPKIFDISHDELWHRHKKGEKAKENSKPKKEVFYEDIMLHYNHLKKKGIKLLMYGDMIVPEHHGRRFDCYQIVDKLPKDIIIKNWSANGVPRSSAYLREKGFDTVINTLNGFKPSPQDNGIIQGFGNISYGPFVTTTQSFTSDEHGYTFCFHALCRSADYAWNMAVDSQLPLSEWCRQKLLNLLPVYSFKPNPSGISKFEPVDITTVANETIEDNITGDGKGWFDLGKKNSYNGKIEDVGEIGLIPMSVKKNSEGNNVIIMRKETGPVAIPLNKQYASLVFLHTCNYPKDTPKEKKNFRKRSNDYLYGIPVGYYVVKYKDGIEEKVAMNYGRNLLEWMPYVPARFVPACRYVWDAQLSGGDQGCLFQYQWVNPYPEKQIENITIVKGKTEADIAIVAITGEKTAVTH